MVESSVCPGCSSPVQIGQAYCVICGMSLRGGPGVAPSDVHTPERAAVQNTMPESDVAASSDMTDSPATGPSWSADAPEDGRATGLSELTVASDPMTTTGAATPDLPAQEAASEEPEPQQAVEEAPTAPELAVDAEPAEPEIAAAPAEPAEPEIVAAPAEPAEPEIAAAPAEPAEPEIGAAPAVPAAPAVARAGSATDPRLAALGLASADANAGASTSLDPRPEPQERIPGGYVPPAADLAASSWALQPSGDSQSGRLGRSIGASVGAIPITSPFPATPGASLPQPPAAAQTVPLSTPHPSVYPPAPPLPANPFLQSAPPAPPAQSPFSAPPPPAQPAPPAQSPSPPPPPPAPPAQSFSAPPAPHFPSAFPTASGPAPIAPSTFGVGVIPPATPITKPAGFVSTSPFAARPLPEQPAPPPPAVPDAASAPAARKESVQELIAFGLVAAGAVLGVASLFLPWAGINGLGIGTLQTTSAPPPANQWGWGMPASIPLFLLGALVLAAASGSDRAQQRLPRLAPVIGRLTDLILPMILGGLYLGVILLYLTLPDGFGSGLFLGQLALLIGACLLIAGSIVTLFFPPDLTADAAETRSGDRIEE